MMSVRVLDGTTVDQHGRTGEEVLDGGRLGSVLDADGVAVLQQRCVGRRIGRGLTAMKTSPRQVAERNSTVVPFGS